MRNAGSTGAHQKQRDAPGPAGRMAPGTRLPGPTGTRWARGNQDPPGPTGTRRAHGNRDEPGPARRRDCRQETGEPFVDRRLVIKTTAVRINAATWPQWELSFLLSGLALVMVVAFWPRSGGERC